MLFGVSSFLGLATVILVMVGTTAVHGATSSGSFCNLYFCLTATYFSATSTIAYNVTTTTAGAWFGVGTGTQMTGATMWISWVDSGSVVMSERQGTGHVPPSISQNPVSQFNTASKVYDGVSTTFTSLWTVPASSPVTSLPMIWAYQSGASPGSTSSSALTQHDAFGTITVDLTNGSVAQQSKSIGSWVESKKTRNLVVAHAVLMVIAWAIAAPVGVLIGRYGRGLFPWVFPHWITQGGITATGSIIGLIVIIVALQTAGQASFNNAHEIVGMILIFAMVLQITAGWYIHHKYDPNRKKRPITNYGHMAFGMFLLILGFASLYTGIERYLVGEPGDKWQKVVFWVWVGIIIVAFIGGYTLIPRQLRKEHDLSMQRREDVTMQKIRHASNSHGLDNHQSGAAGSDGTAWSNNNGTTYLNGADTNNWSYPPNSNAPQRNVI